MTTADNQSRDELDELFRELGFSEDTMGMQWCKDAKAAILKWHEADVAEQVRIARNNEIQFADMHVSTMDLTPEDRQEWEKHRNERLALLRSSQSVKEDK